MSDSMMSIKGVVGSVGAVTVDAEHCDEVKDNQRVSTQDTDKLVSSEKHEKLHAKDKVKAASTTIPNPKDSHATLRDSFTLNPEKYLRYFASMGREIYARRLPFALVTTMIRTILPVVNIISAGFRVAELIKAVKSKDWQLLTPGDKAKLVAKDMLRIGFDLVAFSPVLKAGKVFQFPKGGLVNSAVLGATPVTGAGWVGRAGNALMDVVFGENPIPGMKSVLQKE